MNQNLQHFREPTKTSENNSVYCPYIKSKNIPGRNSPTDLNGTPLDEVCLPNLSSGSIYNPVGRNVCKNNVPNHVSFMDIDNNNNNCYSDNMCKNKMNTCLNAYE